MLFFAISLQFFTPHFIIYTFLYKFFVFLLFCIYTFLYKFFVSIGVFYP